MAAQPLISVCIPAYNHERYVERTIRSILAQTYGRIELLVVDDGSKDATWSVIQSLRGVCEDRFERVVFETQPNQGTCTTLNRLFSLSRGDFVYLIASDDEAVPSALEELQRAIAAGDFVLAACDNAIIDADSNQVAWDGAQNIRPYGEGDYKTFWAYLLRNKRLTRADFRFGSYPSLVRGNYVPNGYLIRRTALQAAGPLTKEAPLEDWWLHLQLSKLGPYVFVDKPLFRYRWHGANTAANAERMQALSRQTLLCELSRVRAADDRERLALLNRESPIRRRDLIRLGGLLALWDEADFGHKRRILRIFNRTFVIKDKINP